VPTLQGRRDVGIHLTPQVARPVPLLPDLSLERLEPRGLLVPIHQRVHVGGDRGGVVRVLGPESGDVGADLGIIPMALEKSTHPGARITEQRLVDEFDGCGRALDVQQDGADLRQRDAVRSGMYAGPMQSGW
jgi:hypothetical protein